MSVEHHPELHLARSPQQQPLLQASMSAPVAT